MDFDYKAELELQRQEEELYQKNRAAWLPENEKHDGVLRLRKALQHDMKAFCSGVCSIVEGKTILYYGKDPEIQ